VVLAALSPSQQDTDETCKTLEFASAISQLPPGRLRRNTACAAAALQLQEEVQRLKQQIQHSSDPQPSLASVSDSLAFAERVLRRTTRDGKQCDRIVAEVDLAHRQRGLSTRGTLMADANPFLTNLSADAQLHGVLVFQLGPAAFIEISRICEP